MLLALKWLWGGLGVALGWPWWSLGGALVEPWWSLGGALGWLWGGSVLRSLCLVYGLGVALGWPWGGFGWLCGPFIYTSFRPATPGATPALASPQHPKWNQPRKGARDAARHSRSRSQNSLNAETQRFAARPSRRSEEHTSEL